MRRLKDRGPGNPLNRRHWADRQVRYLVARQLLCWDAFPRWDEKWAGKRWAGIRWDARHWVPKDEEPGGSRTGYDSRRAANSLRRHHR